MKSSILRLLQGGFIAVAVLLASSAIAQQSPAAKDSIVLGGKVVSVKYSAPSVRGRDIFGATGLLSTNPNYPVWRAGANAATALHTDLDLAIGGLRIPKGDYTLFVNLANTEHWELIINKQTGQGGLTYDPAQDLGRVKMKMSKPGSPVEKLFYTLTIPDPKQVKMVLAWENHAGEVSFSVR
ncbi:MAG: DUF2911 domain-containing protein [Sediminibacterium sp.]